jgi:hypothetical protein
VSEGSAADPKRGRLLPRRLPDADHTRAPSGRLWGHPRRGQQRNPAESGTPGGGSGGAIYNDGNTMTLSVCGSRIEANQVNAYGSAIFFVSNSHTGSLRVEDSVIRDNEGGGWNVFARHLDARGQDQVTLDSIIE